MDNQLVSAAKWFGGSLVLSSIIVAYALTSIGTSLDRSATSIHQGLDAVGKGMSSAALRSQNQTLTLRTFNGPLQVDMKPLTVKVEEVQQ